MAPAPVSLAEARAFLNLGVGDTADDEEVWGNVLAAVDMVEARVGALEPRTVTSRIRPSSREIVLPEWPVLSVQSVTDTFTSETVTLESDAVVGQVITLPAVWPWRWRPGLTVTYTVGRDPVPPSLREAVLLQAGLLWESQRGPAMASRFTAVGGDVSSSGGIARLRLNDIIGVYKMPAIG